MLKDLKKIKNSLFVKTCLFQGAVVFVLMATWGGSVYYNSQSASPTILNETPLILAGSFIFVCALFMLMFIFQKVVISPVKKLTKNTHLTANGDHFALKRFGHSDEIGKLAAAIDLMGQKLRDKQAELNKQKNEYQNLFELVPCIITVQDKEYKLIGFNREFAEKFAPHTGEHCYSAYKGRKKKCAFCPVEKTFRDGLPHYSEETGVNKDGSTTHWIVKTAPVRDHDGNIIAAMEMSLDVTPVKQLQNKLEESEKKYFDIFNNIPNAVFVVDVDSLEILDCNESVTSLYKYQKSEIQNQSFLNIFLKDEMDLYKDKISVSNELNNVKHTTRDGDTLFVNIRISPSKYRDKKVHLVTTSDVTERLETELQLIQAGKMATLGEMATGVAHELNQPLSVIKTAGNFFMKKIKNKEKIKDDIFLLMAEEIDSHVDRASSIINHLREFGRKTDISLQAVQVNDILKKAFEIFRQQFKLREIETTWCLGEDLPYVMAEPGRLEQVFINLLINARDAIEEKSQNINKQSKIIKAIIITTNTEHNRLIIKIEDTGIGVPKTIFNKIFEPFFTTKKVGKGTGIGLSISYSIIKDFGGSISVANTDNGACFAVEMPCKDV